MKMNTCAEPSMPTGQPPPSGIMERSQIIKANSEPVRVDYTTRRRGNRSSVSNISSAVQSARWRLAMADGCSKATCRVGSLVSILPVVLTRASATSCTRAFENSCWASRQDPTRKNLPASWGDHFTLGVLRR
jgi:hypothetical protein